jgi:hypothetical protein
VGGFEFEDVGYDVLSLGGRAELSVFKCLEEIQTFQNNSSKESHFKHILKQYQTKHF